MKIAKNPGIQFIVVILFLLVLTSSGYCKSFQDMYYTFDRWAANYDPLGKALTPLNNIPQLKVSGLFYQWSFFNIHADEKVGYVDKDWRAQQIQFMGELHTRWQFAPRKALVNKFHYVYDGVYDWQRSSLSADQWDAEAKRTNSWGNFIREFHLDMELGNWYMKFGKQQVVWGKMEGRWMDFINNLDRKDGLQVRSLYYNELRIPLWMSNITHTFGASSLQFLWIPDFEPDIAPYPGGVWYSPLRPHPRDNPLYRGDADEPGPSFSNHQWAIRYDTKISRVTWSIGYMYGFSPTLTSFVHRDNAGQLYYDPEYTRRHFIGSALDFAYMLKHVPLVNSLPMVVRAEVVYTTKQYFLDSEKLDVANDLLIGQGVTETDLLRGAVQIKFYFPGKTSFTYQPMFGQYFGWKRSLGINRWSLGHLFMISKFFKTFEDRLNATIYTFLNTGGPLNGWQGTKTQLVLSYKFSDNIQGKLHYVDYRGGVKDTYGQYDLWDNVGWEISYEF